MLNIDMMAMYKTRVEHPSQRDPSLAKEVHPTPKTADYFSTQKDNMELP